MTNTKEWSAKRILRELCTPQRRREVLAAFWKHSEEMNRRLAAAQLAKTMRFREETIRKAPIEKKSDWLATRIGDPELTQFFEAALLAFHIHNRTSLMKAMLDRLDIPNENGSIEAEDYPMPTEEKVRAAVDLVRQEHPSADIALYLATAGLIMGEAGDEWRESMWPVATELAADLDVGQA